MAVRHKKIDFFDSVVVLHCIRGTVLVSLWKGSLNIESGIFDFHAFIYALILNSQEFEILVIQFIVIRLEFESLMQLIYEIYFQLFLGVETGTDIHKESKI